MNNLTLIGYLGSEPAACMSDGLTAVRISLCVTLHTGRKEKETEWLEVYLTDSLAIIAQQFFHTGDKVHVEGHLESGKYESRDGKTRYYTRIVADEADKLSTAKRNQKLQTEND